MIFQKTKNRKQRNEMTETMDDLMKEVETELQTSHAKTPRTKGRYAYGYEPGDKARVKDGTGTGPLQGVGRPAMLSKVFVFHSILMGSL